MIKRSLSLDVPRSEDAARGGAAVADLAEGELALQAGNAHGISHGIVLLLLLFLPYYNFCGENVKQL